MFRLIPHSITADEFCDLLIWNPILTTWWFAAAFFLYWTNKSCDQEKRRACLITVVVALALAGIVTMALRPFVYWAAPSLNPTFQRLFPRYRWGTGNVNCFPSHSTLVYFLTALGFWPINRMLSFSLSSATLLLISLPRLYVGGHYPVDVLFSCILSMFTLLAAWRWVTPRIKKLTNHGFAVPQPLGRLLLFLWLFELGEGFHGSELLVSYIHHLSTRFH
jgi:undecaprenyl-diphosphatase